MAYSEEDLQLEGYNYHLPPHLIAQRPVSPRDHSRLLVFDSVSNKVTHTHFHQLTQHLPAKCPLVFNQSKVLPCRLNGKRPTGGKAELFVLNPAGPAPYRALIRTTSKKKVGDLFYFDDELSAKIDSQLDSGIFVVSFNRENLIEELFKWGKTPIPPYIRDGLGDARDADDYQTVYANEWGSVAAPTAGLHFTRELLDKFKKNEWPNTSITLHVGHGTFSPLKNENVSENKLHEEHFLIEKGAGQVILNNWGNLIAVGTTSLRVLESCKDESGDFCDPGRGPQKTSLFLYPGRPIHSIKGLITNFHLPKSSLLILVSAFIGRQKALELYELAVEKQYRFFSYGDAMLLLK